MIGIIWYYTEKEKGNEKFVSLLEDYEEIGIKVQIVVNSLSDTYAILENGDRWELVKAREASRGKACNVALVEQGIPDKILYEIIMPTIKSYPYQAYNYY